MNYAALILRKDIRCLRRELALMAILAVSTAWAFTHLVDPSWVVVIAEIGVNYTIAAVIQEDAVAGDTPFWITRPYPPLSMLAAKLLFLFFFVQLPTMLVYVYAIGARGFPIADSLAGLVTFQLLMFVCAVAPVACLASLTTGLVQLLFAEVAALGLMFSGFGLTWLGNLAWIPLLQAGPPSADWLRASLAAVAVALVSGCVLYRQYTKRATSQNRILAAGGALAAVVVYIFLPWKTELDVQTWMSPNTSGATKIRGTLEPIAKAVFPMKGRARISPSEVNLPITLRGFSSDERLIVDALYLRLTGPSGRVCNLDLVPVATRPAAAGEALMNAEAEVDPDFFAAEGPRPVTLHATIYLTLFGTARNVTIPIRPTPVGAIDGLQCAESSLIGLACGAMFRWPERLVTADSGDNMGFVSSVSYSPFPAGLDSAPVEIRTFSLPWSAKEVTIASRAPTGHVRAAIDIADVVLKNYTLGAKIWADHGFGVSQFQ